MSSEQFLTIPRRDPVAAFGNDPRGDSGFHRCPGANFRMRAPHNCIDEGVLPERVTAIGN
jgi:hypothetical protein